VYTGATKVSTLRHMAEKSCHVNERRFDKASTLRKGVRLRARAHVARLGLFMMPVVGISIATAALVASPPAASASLERPCFNTFERVVVSRSGLVVVGGAEGNNEFSGGAAVSRSAVYRFEQSGGLDLSWGENGVAYLGDQFEWRGWRAQPINGMVEDSEQRLLVLIHHSGGNEVVRLNRDGTMDSTFGINGRTLLPSTSFAEGTGLAVDSQNRPVVWGANEQARVSVQRLSDIGALDRSFGRNGTVDVGDARTASISDLSMFGTKPILLITNVERGSVLMRRLTDSGKVDRTFAKVGSLRLNWPSSAREFGSQLIVDSSGTVTAVVSLDRPGGIGIARVNSSGRLKTEFGRRGLATPVTSDVVTPKIAPLTDGSFAITYGEQSGFWIQNVIRRTLSDGSIDGGFAGAGTLTLPYLPSQYWITSIAPLPGASFAVVGRVNTSEEVGSGSQGDYVTLVDGTMLTSSSIRPDDTQPNRKFEATGPCSAPVDLDDAR
jgi:hypothetical protein